MIGDNYPICDVCDAFMDSSFSSFTCHRCMAESFGLGLFDFPFPKLGHHPLLPLPRQGRRRDSHDHEDDVRPDHEDGRKRTDDNLRSVFG